MRSKRNRHKSRRKRGRGANKKIVRKRKTERGRRRAAQRRARVPPFVPVSFTKDQAPPAAAQQLSPEEQRFEVYQRGFANPFPARAHLTPAPAAAAMPEGEERHGWYHHLDRALANVPRVVNPSAYTLPPGWAEATDPADGATYYYNTTTGATQWERPTPVWRSLPPFSATLVPTHDDTVNLYQLLVRGLNEGDEGAEAREELTERLREAGAIHNPDDDDSDSSSDDGDGPNPILTREDVKMLLKEYGQRGRQGAQGIPAGQLPKMVSARHGSALLAKPRGGSRRRHKRRRKTRRRRRSRRRRRR